MVMLAFLRDANTPLLASDLWLPGRNGKEVPRPPSAFFDLLFGPRMASSSSMLSSSTATVQFLSDLLEGPAPPLSLALSVLDSEMNSL